MAGGDAAHLRELKGLPDEELRNDADNKNPPHDHADQGGTRPFGETFIEERVHDSQVALDADAGQRLGRAVEVAIETGRDHSAGSLSEHPVVSIEMVVNLEEEGDQEEEVGDGQAAVEDGRGHLPNFGSHREQDGDVGWDPNDDHQDVNDGDDLSAQRAAEVLC